MSKQRNMSGTMAAIAAICLFVSTSGHRSQAADESAESSGAGRIRIMIGYVRIAGLPAAICPKIESNIRWNLQERMASTRRFEVIQLPGTSGLFSGYGGRNSSAPFDTIRAIARASEAEYVVNTTVYQPSVRRESHQVEVEEKDKDGNKYKVKEWRYDTYVGIHVRFQAVDVQSGAPTRLYEVPGLESSTTDASLPPTNTDLWAMWVEAAKLPASSFVGAWYRPVHGVVKTIEAPDTHPGADRSVTVNVGERDGVGEDMMFSFYRASPDGVSVPVTALIRPGDTTPTAVLGKIKRIGLTDCELEVGYPSGGFFDRSKIHVTDRCLEAVQVGDVVEMMPQHQTEVAASGSEPAAGSAPPHEARGSKRGGNLVHDLLGKVLGGS